MRRRELRLALVLALLLGGACQGPRGDAPQAGDKPPQGPKQSGEEPSPGLPDDDGPAPGNDPEPIDDGRCEPSRVTLRRLNRTEYNHTIRDLTGLDLRPADDFPDDDYGYGFDNIGDVLTVSPLFFEKLDQAAERVVDAVLYLPLQEPSRFSFEAEEVGSDVGRATAEGWNLSSNGELSVVAELPEDGAYAFRVRAYGQQAGSEPVRMQLRKDSEVLAILDVTAGNGAWQVYEVSAEASAGPVTFAVAFVNDYYEPGVADRNLVVDWLEVEGPTDLGPPEVPEARARVMVCDPAEVGEEACAREIFAAFGKRAWRRPLGEEELNRLLTFLDVAEAEGEGFEEGIRLGLHAILLSPHFLYRVELDDEAAPGEVRELTPYELASRPRLRHLASRVSRRRSIPRPPCASASSSTAPIPCAQAATRS